MIHKEAMPVIRKLNALGKITNVSPHYMAHTFGSITGHQLGPQRKTLKKTLAIKQIK